MTLPKKSGLLAQLAPNEGWAEPQILPLIMFEIKLNIFTS